MGRIIGDDGGYTMGETTTAGHHGIIRTWALNIQRAIVNVSGHGDGMERNRVGFVGYTGTLTGVPKDNEAGSAPNALEKNDAVTTTLTLTAATSYVLEAVFGNMALASDKPGDASLTFNIAGGDVDPNLTETWDETP